jgi:hypothetical protein
MVFGITLVSAKVYILLFSHPATCLDTKVTSLRNKIVHSSSTNGEDASN